MADTRSLRDTRCSQPEAALSRRYRVRRYVVGQLIDGEWHAGQAFARETGEFVRQVSRFRDWSSAEATSRFKAEPGR